MTSPNHKAEGTTDAITEEDAKAILYRLDERTERIDNQLERMDDRTTRLVGRVTTVEKATEQNANDIRRNTTILNAITFGIGSGLAALWARFEGLINF